MTRALASVLVDDAIVRALLPLACPSDFGPDNRYELEELIGAGRDSLVYRAVDRKFASENFQPKVCIKITRSETQSRKEALAARRVGHPHVVAILDQGIDAAGYSYIVAEYIDGGDLNDATVPWSPRRAATMMAKIARGMQAVHAAGVAHCDLKPANIMLTAAGEPKVVDFELSRWAEQSDERPRGNPAFMSPEQFRREPNSLSFPSDVYALGGLLFWLLSGKRPAGDTPDEIVAFHNGHRELPELPVGGDLARVCLRALAPKVADRHNSAGEFAEDLERWLKHVPIPWTKPSTVRSIWMSSRRKPVRALLVMLVGLEVATILGLNQYLARRDQQYAIRLEAEARAQSAKVVAGIRAKMLRSVRNLSYAVGVAAAGDAVDSLLPTLVWLQWLTDTPATPVEGRLMTAQLRVEALSQLIASAREKGREDSLDVLLAAYSLSYFEVELGLFDEPAALLAWIRSHWTGRLASQDQMWPAIGALERCVEANRQVRAGGLSKELHEELEQLRVKLINQGNASPVVRLIERLLQRADDGPVPASLSK